MNRFKTFKTAAMAASMMMTVSLSAYADGTLSFKGIDAPATDAEKRSVVVTDKAVINGKALPVSYNVIMRSGDKPGKNSEPFGQIYDKDGDPITRADGSPFISSDNDFSSLLTGKDGKLYMVSHFESVPAAMYVTQLKQEKNGKLKAVETRHIDFSNVAGGWVHCAGSVTPWGTHLGSEEYEPDANAVDPSTGKFNDEYDNKMAMYFDLKPDKADQPGYFSGVNAYDYGWSTEVAVKDFSNVGVTKHYAMGRFSHELEYVMPDHKTVYLSDDGTNVGLFRFVADKAGDLSSGELFAAKWNQTGADNGGTAVLTWVSLGHATNSEIKSYLDNGTKFADIFDSVSMKDGASCPADYKHINTTWGEECLKVKDGMDMAASRLESRRYAAMMGATTEFRKMEGLTFNPETMTLYMSISEIGKGMEDNSKNDKGGNNDIRVAKNTCGAVYALQLDTHYRAVTMEAEVIGKPLTPDYGAENDTSYYKAGPYANNKCDLDGIANPDNITFIPGYNTLMIGEDSGDGHENDAVWSYNVKTKELTRILATPYGSETTSLYYYPNYHGHGYLMTVVQHPYGEPTTNMPQPLTNSDTRAYTGYIGPFPKMSK